MDSKAKRWGVFSLFAMLLAAALIYLLKNVDVAPVGPFERVVGLSSINGFFVELFGYDAFWYKITNTPGMILYVLVALFFTLTGLKQWVERKSILKVDRNLLVLGGTYFISLVIYVLFEKFVINFRPVIVPGEEIFESSFPSSHTMFGVVVIGTAIMECCRTVKNKKFKMIINSFLFASMLICIVGRIISGVHWFTDILGGIFIGLALLFLYASLVCMASRKSNIKKFKVERINN